MAEKITIFQITRVAFKHQRVDYELTWNFRTFVQLFTFFLFRFQFKIQFDDSLTATFEYPSETSLLVDEWLGDDDEVDANFYGRSNSASSTSNLLNSVPLGKWIIHTHDIDKIWCYMCFRFNTIRQLSATESKRNDIWIGRDTNYSIAVFSIKWRQHVHIESRVRQWRLFKASNRRGESTMEQRRYEGNGPVVLNTHDPK